MSVQSSVDDNCILVPVEAVTVHQLKGNDLLIYSLIRGARDVDDYWFYGGIAAICRRVNCSDTTALESIKRLISKNLILKQVSDLNSTVVRYQVTR